MVGGTVGGVGTNQFERCDGIWFYNINRERIPQFCAWYWDSVLSYCCSSIISVYRSEPLLVILCDTLSQLEVKVNFFHIWICWMTDASFICKMPLKLIHFKSMCGWGGGGVTLSRFIYFKLFVTFAAKLIYFLLHTAVLHCIYTILNIGPLTKRIYYEGNCCIHI